MLRSVQTDLVPHLASALAVLSGAIDLFVLIYFIHHTASSIQASSVIAAVSGEIVSQVPRLFPDALGRGDPPATKTELDRIRHAVTRNGVEVRAAADGYIRVLDQESLLTLATAHDLLLVIEARPGDFVYRGTTVARVAPSPRSTPI
ncbi:MAG: DUF2254 family protein [Candidatus Eisenbacteria bacterium]